MKVKPKRTFVRYFIRVLFLIPILLFVYFSFITEHTWGINKTVGWAWDITNINFWIGIVFLIVFVLIIIALTALVIKKLVEIFSK